MTSLWLARAPSIETDAFEPGAEFDEVVIGAGITGLVTALMLASEGRRVAVVEARTVGAVTSGNTTAKLSQLQGTQFQKVLHATYRAVLQGYADGNRAAFEWLVDYLTSHNVPFERRDSVTWAETEDGVASVEREHALARSVGLPTRLADDVGLPFPVRRAVVLPDQVQFDPMLVLAALAAEFRMLGGRIFEGVRVTGVAVRGFGAPARAHVATGHGTLIGGHVVLATGTPILDRGLYFAKVGAYRSYAMAFRAGQLPPGMYINAETPTRSIRTHTGLLITGGNGHGVGRHPSPARAQAELREWTQRRWDDAVLEYSWAAQDYVAPHHVPFVGWFPRGRRRILLATGFDKWGMTNSVAAAMTIVSDLLGGQTDWQRALRHRVTMPNALASGIGENLAVAGWYAKSWTRTLTRRLPASVPEGTGASGRIGLRPAGISTIDGRTCIVSTVCAHRYAAVSWNDGEQSWDCPAHGSRFAPDGTRLEGPAVRDLRRL